MARNRQSIVKMSRREGYALHQKAHKIMARRSAKPGEISGRGGRRGPGRDSQYALQLREKQKVKRLYGLLERQFAKLMTEAGKTKGQSGEVILQYLELRADNAVYRAGFAVSRQAARQLVSHGHFLLNDHRVNIPSIRLKVGDQLKVRGTSQKSAYFSKLDDVSPKPAALPAWLKVDRKKFEITVVELPQRDDAEPDINEQLIVEYYSR